MSSDKKMEPAWGFIFLNQCEASVFVLYCPSVFVLVWICVCVCACAVFITLWGEDVCWKIFSKPGKKNMVPQLMHYLCPHTKRYLFQTCQKPLAGCSWKEISFGLWPLFIHYFIHSFIHSFLLEDSQPRVLPIGIFYQSPVWDRTSEYFHTDGEQRRELDATTLCGANTYTLAHTLLV